MDDFAPPASDDYSSDLESPARTAAVLGIIGLTMHALICCTSIFGSMIGTILGGVALLMGRSVLAQEPTGEALAYANVGFWTGVIAVAWGCFIAFGIFCYIMLYVVMFGAIFAAGL